MPLMPEPLAGRLPGARAQEERLPSCQRCGLLPAAHQSARCGAPHRTVLGGRWRLGTCKERGRRGAQGAQGLVSAKRSGG